MTTREELIEKLIEISSCGNSINHEKHEYVIWAREYIKSWPISEIEEVLARNIAARLRS